MAQNVHERDVVKPRIRRPSVVQPDGSPIECLNLDALLHERGFYRVPVPSRSAMRLYNVVGRELGFHRRAIKRMARLVESELKKNYNDPAYQHRMDQWNDRYRMLSRMFRCTILIFGVFDLKHHRFFSSGDDIRAIMLFEEHPGAFQVLRPYVTHHQPLMQPFNSPIHYGGMMINEQALSEAFAMLNMTPNSGASDPGMMPFFYPQQFHPQSMFGGGNFF